jgi:tetratricopeptide (TPR) repeat protein
LIVVAFVHVHGDGSTDVPIGTLVARAEAERTLGHIDVARTLAGSALERSPRYSSAHIVIGRCCLEVGDPSRALEPLGKAVEIDGENVLALRLLAEALALAGMAQEAEVMFDRLGRVTGEDEDASLARQLLHLGESDPAQKDEDEEAMGIVRGSMTPEEILDAADLRLEEAFETPTMARICEEQGLYDTALVVYQTLMEKHPDSGLLAGKVAQLKKRIEAEGTVVDEGQAIATDES